MRVSDQYRETLMMAAHTRMPGHATTADKEAFVEDLIKRLGLTKAADSVVGDKKKRGLSGGEKKRLSIGAELIAEPVLLFTDEPTTGLDSFQAEKVCMHPAHLKHNVATCLSYSQLLFHPGHASGPCLCLCGFSMADPAHCDAYVSTTAAITQEQLCRQSSIHKSGGGKACPAAMCSRLMGLCLAIIIVIIVIIMIMFRHITTMSACIVQVMQTLKDLCKEGHTVISSIHQPRSSIFAMFDDLILLSEGRMLYSGPAFQALAYFEELGHHCPHHYNPAEFLADLISVDASTPEAQEKTRYAAHSIHFPFCMLLYSYLCSTRSSFRWLY